MEEQRFSEEIEKIFLKGMFVDSGYRFSQKNDYHSFLVGKYPIVVRDDAVYDNVCDHRLALTHPLGYGNQKFICGYHGIDQSHAKQYPHYRYKNLLFMGERDPLVISLLDKYNYKADNHFLHYELTFKANWKLFVENVIDILHVPYVHAASKNLLSSFLSLDQSLTPEHIRYGKHSVERITKEPSKRYKKYIDEWKWENIYIFPNLFISNVSNVVTFIAYFIPEKYNEVTVIYEGFFNKEGMDKRITDVIKRSAENFVPTILLEDKPFIEGCWQGILSGQTKYSLVKGKEIRQRWFLENFKCIK
jgi:phenylpropionate dioxygenase-like ring-hydroxylating dioxygenase large terminal subunit